jgi:hypothetical protein
MEFRNLNMDIKRVVKIKRLVSNQLNPILLGERIPHGSLPREYTSPANSRVFTSIVMQSYPLLKVFQLRGATSVRRIYPLFPSRKSLRDSSSMT